MVPLRAMSIENIHDWVNTSCHPVDDVDFIQQSLSRDPIYLLLKIVYCFQHFEITVHKCTPKRISLHIQYRRLRSPFQ